MNRPVRAMGLDGNRISATSPWSHRAGAEMLIGGFFTPMVLKSVFHANHIHRVRNIAILNAGIVIIMSVSLSLLAPILSF